MEAEFNNDAAGSGHSLISLKTALRSAGLTGSRKSVKLDDTTAPQNISLPPSRPLSTTDYENEKAGSSPPPELEKRKSLRGSHSAIEFKTKSPHGSLSLLKKAMSAHASLGDVKNSKADLSALNKNPAKTFEKSPIDQTVKAEDETARTSSKPVSKTDSKATIVADAEQTRAPSKPTSRTASKTASVINTADLIAATHATSQISGAENKMSRSKPASRSTSVAQGPTSNSVYDSGTNKVVKSDQAAIQNDDVPLNLADESNIEKSDDLLSKETRTSNATNIAPDGHKPITQQPLSETQNSIASSKPGSKVVSKAASVVNPKEISATPREESLVNIPDQERPTSKPASRFASVTKAPNSAYDAGTDKIVNSEKNVSQKDDVPLNLVLAPEESKIDKSSTQDNVSDQSDVIRSEETCTSRAIKTAPDSHNPTALTLPERPKEVTTATEKTLPKKKIKESFKGNGLSNADERKPPVNNTAQSHKTASDVTQKSKKEHGDSSTSEPSRIATASKKTPPKKKAAAVKTNDPINVIETKKDDNQQQTASVIVHPKPKPRKNKSSDNEKSTNVEIPKNDAPVVTSDLSCQEYEAIRSNEINYSQLVATLRQEVDFLRNELGMKAQTIEEMKMEVMAKLKDKDIEEAAAESEDKMNAKSMVGCKHVVTDIDKAARILLDRQKKAYQILVAKLRREIRRLKFQKNSLSDPLLEAQFFPYLPRSVFGISSSLKKHYTAGTQVRRTSDYFGLNPPPPTGNHPDGGTRWWWGSKKHLVQEKKNIVFPKFSVDMNAAAKIYGKSRKPRTAPERTSGAAGTSGFDHNASLARPATRAGTVIVRSDHSSSMGGFLTMDEFLESSKVESRNTLKPGDVRVGDRVCVFINEERCLGMVKYLGLFDPQPDSGQWCGIKLDRPLGKHNGVVRGRRYFSCKENHGLLVKLEKIQCVMHPFRNLNASRENTAFL